MGARLSKTGCLSKHDDLVADNHDVVAKLLYGAKECFGIPSKRRPRQVSSAGLQSHKLPDNELLPLVVFCDGESSSSIQSDDLIPAGTQHYSCSDWSADTDLPEVTSAAAACSKPGWSAGTASSFRSKHACRPTDDTDLDPSADASCEAATAVLRSKQWLQRQDGAVATASSSPIAASAAVIQEAPTRSVTAHAAAQDATTTAAAGHETKACLLGALEVSKSDREAASASAAAARRNVEMLFANVDAEQQLQDKEQALISLAAAAGCSKPVLTAEEKQALRAAGEATQQAAAEQLAVQLQETDAAVQKMSEECRVQWFQDHACQTTADAAEVSFEDEWSSLPPEVLAMVQELQARP